MHCYILKENLVKALSVIGRSIPTRPQLPILSNILLKAHGTLLTLHASNLEIGTLYTLPAKIEKEGEVAIPGKLFTELISSMISDKIECELDGTNFLVKGGKTKTSLATSSASDFPPFPIGADGKKSLPYEILNGLVVRTVFAASSDETRPVFTGIRLTMKGKILSLAATDGYRMSMEQESVEGSDDFQIIIPAQSLSEVIRIAGEVKAEKIGFSILEQKNQIVFTLPNILFFTRLIDGEFPNIEKIIPQSFHTKVTIEREQLAQSVKISSLFARGAANIIKIKIEKNGLRLTANSPQIGTNEDFVEGKVEGEESEIAFNYRFLLDLLSNFPEKDVVFESSGPLNPGIFKPASSKSSFLHIIMPVRVQN